MYSPLKIILLLASSIATTSFLLMKLSSIAARIKLVDYPGGRKIHASPKPLIGGIGMVMGLSLSCLLFVPLTSLRGFFMGLILLAFAGFLDDYKELNHWSKFLAQAGAVFFMIYFSGTLLVSFGDLLAVGDLNVGVLAIPVTVFCTLGVVNAINMIDGLDGLAGGISLVGFMAFTALSYLSGQGPLMLLSISFCGIIIAFLRYNLHPAKLFMGDAGSMSLGFALAFLSISVTQSPGSTIPPAAPLLVLAVPITDTLILIAIRAYKRKNPFEADKSHLHHILIKFGYNEGATTAFIVIVSAAFSALAIAGTVLETPEHYLFGVFMAYFLGSCALALNIKSSFRAFLRYKRRHAREERHGLIGATAEIMRFVAGSLGRTG